MSRRSRNQEKAMFAKMKNKNTFYHPASRRRSDRSTHSLRMDDKKRSKQPWERGRKASKKGNPRYMPKTITDKNGNRRKVYVCRPPAKPGPIGG